MAEQTEQRQRYGYTDETGNRVSALRDMFDGGGPGRSGERFEGGGALSSLGNALGGPGMFGGGDGGGMNMGRAAGSMMGGMAFGPIGGLLGGLIGQNMQGGYGYTDAMGNQVSAGTDMMDGGGRGMAGDTFQGGPFSGLLNALGVRPRGYDARQAAMQQDTSAPSLMAQPVQRPAPVPQTYGMTSMPALTMDQIQMLRQMGINTDAMAGEPATASEMAALLRSPGALLSMNNPQVGRMYEPPNPGATIQPDGSSMPRYNVPMTAGVSMGQPDLGTIRPFVSRSTGRIPPMQDFLPVMDIRPPPPAMLLPR
jgi:hypothetical protein